MVTREGWEWQANLEARGTEETGRGCCRRMKEPLVAPEVRVVQADSVSRASLEEIPREEKGSVYSVPEKVPLAARGARVALEGSVLRAAPAEKAWADLGRCIGS